MKIKMKNILLILSLFLFAVACAPGNEKYVEEAAGFWAGLWHGMICVVTLIISIFDCSVRIYEMNNTGWWYDFGFVLGAGFAFSNIWLTGKKTANKN